MTIVNYDTPSFFILRVDGIEDRAVGGYDEGAHADLLGRPDALRALLAVAAHGPWRGRRRSATASHVVMIGRHEVLDHVYSE